MSIHECLLTLWNAYRPYAEVGLIAGIAVGVVSYIRPTKEEDWRLGYALWMGVSFGLLWPPVLALMHHWLG